MQRTCLDFAAGHSQRPPQPRKLRTAARASGAAILLAPARGDEDGALDRAVFVGCVSGLFDTPHTFHAFVLRITRKGLILSLCQGCLHVDVDVDGGSFIRWRWLACYPTRPAVSRPTDEQRRHVPRRPGYLRPCAVRNTKVSSLLSTRPLRRSMARMRAQDSLRPSHSTHVWVGRGGVASVDFKSAEFLSSPTACHAEQLFKQDVLCGCLHVTLPCTQSRQPGARCVSAAAAH